MTAVVLIFLLTVGAMIALVLYKPAVHIGHVAVSIFWVAPFLGALLLFAGGWLTAAEIGAGLAADTAVNPLKILVLFFSMTLISTFLDEAGFFRYLAGVVLRSAGKSQRVLFCYLYFAVAVLTVFTSNDIVVLTFTPFICYFAKNARIDPLPYLIAEFVSANTWSMMLIVGNPTNIYLAAGGGISFLSYLQKMLLPSLLAGFVSFLVLWLLFGKKLAAPILGSAPVQQISDRPSVALGLLSLLGCIVLMTLSSYLNFAMWLIAAVACVGLYVSATLLLLVRRRSLLLPLRGLLRAPLDVIPFVLSMFVSVLALHKYGATVRLAQLLCGRGEIFSFGVASLLAANLLNNIPMSVLFSSVVEAGGSGTGILLASVIGSNIGAFLTPVGALAGIMWIAMLREHGVSLSFRKFMLYGVTVAVPALLAALLGLYIVI